MTAVAEKVDANTRYEVCERIDRVTYHARCKSLPAEKQEKKMREKPRCDKCKYYRRLKLQYGETLESHCCVVWELVPTEPNDIEGWVQEVQANGMCEMFSKREINLTQAVEILKRDMWGDDPEMKEAKAVAVRFIESVETWVEQKIQANG